MADGRHLENRKIAISRSDSTGLHRVWHDDAHWPSQPHWTTNEILFTGQTRGECNLTSVRGGHCWAVQNSCTDRVAVWGTQCGPTNHELDGLHTGATWWIRLNLWLYQRTDPTARTYAIVPIPLSAADAVECHLKLSPVNIRMLCSLSTTCCY